MIPSTLHKYRTGIISIYQVSMPRVILTISPMQLWLHLLWLSLSFKPNMIRNVEHEFDGLIKDTYNENMQKYRPRNNIKEKKSLPT